MLSTKVIFILSGGFGLFFYGMTVLTGGLQRIAGQKLKDILHTLTKSPIRGVFVGTTITAIIQSSSATTVLVVGFLNAHLMALRPAIGVIMGANIGTTITAQIMALKITQYALPAIAIGVFLKFFVPNRRIKKWGDILIGFGMVFYGIHMMKEAFIPLKSSESFRHLFVVFGQNPLLGILTGAILTALVQSSSASIGIVIGIASAGLIDINSAFALILGDNIGTTITAQLAAMNGSISSKRAAWVHTLFNVIGALYMYVFLFVQIEGQPIFLYFINKFTPGNVFAGTNISRHIANCHSIFNIFNALVFIPFIPLMEKFVVRIIPGEDIFDKEEYLDINDIDIPELAMERIIKATHNMGIYAQESVKKSIKGLYEDKDYLEKVLEMEKYVDNLQLQITQSIIKVQEKAVSEELSKKAAVMLHIVNDMEKIGDYAENIANLVAILQEHKRKGLELAIQDIKPIEEKVQQIVTFSLDALLNLDKESALKASELEGEIDNMKDVYHKTHIKRLGKECSITTSIIYADIVSNLERVADHAYTISKLLLMEVYQ